MINPPDLSTEQARIFDLYDYMILDTGPEEDYEEIIWLATKIFNVPMAAITLIDSYRQWFKAKLGLEMNETSRDISFCNHTIASGKDIFIVEDASKDHRFLDNPFVMGTPDIRFYAGVPLISNKGNRLGALCVIDSMPRKLGADQQSFLRILGKQVTEKLELHKKNLLLKRIAAREMRLRQDLEEMSNFQKKIISIIAHDVRNPIAALKTLVGLINASVVEFPQSSEMLQMADRQLDGILQLLETLVEWGRLPLNQTELNKKLCNINELVNNELLNHGVMAGIKNNVLLNLIKCDVIINTEENTLRFIIRNLLTNAIKFTENGEISVNAIIIDDKIYFRIKDTGVGMTLQLQQILFKPNQKTTRRGTQNEAGSGLGLMLVNEFTKKLGGTIKVESEVNQGTSIILIFDA